MRLHSWVHLPTGGWGMEDGACITTLEQSVLRLRGGLSMACHFCCCSLRAFSVVHFYFLQYIYLFVHSCIYTYWVRHSCAFINTGCLFFLPARYILLMLEALQWNVWWAVPVSLWPQCVCSCCYLHVSVVNAMKLPAYQRLASVRKKCCCHGGGYLRETNLTDSLTVSWYLQWWPVSYLHYSVIYCIVSVMKWRCSVKRWLQMFMQCGCSWLIDKLLFYCNV
jgi:hypothetical protein